MVQKYDMPEEMKEEVNKLASEPFAGNDNLRAQFISNIKFAGNQLEPVILLCYGLGLTAGWWHNAKTKLPEPNRDFGNIAALIHSEISEAFEAHRKGAKDDHLPQYPGKIVELADAVIRIFDYVGSSEEMLGQFMSAFEDKLMYNTQRADHKMDARAADGGKKL